MGTSLSGLTPATTFDGLLKTSDNEPLDGTLKAISTGDGTDTILQLSNSALQVNGDLNVGSVHKIYQDNTNLNIIGNSGSTALKYFTNFGNNNTNQFGLNNFFRYAVGIGFTSTQSSAMLNIKGSGTTSATTSLLVQNSAGSELFKVADDGRVDLGSLFVLGTNIFGTNSSYRINIAGSNEYQTFDSHIFKAYDGTAYTEAMRIVGNNASHKVGIGIAAPTSKLHIKGDGTGTANYSFKVQNAIGNNNMQIRDDGAVFLTNNRYTFNAAGGAVFKGSGTTSATTSLLVQNSAGTDLLKVTDDGVTTIDGSLVVDFFTFNGNKITAPIGLKAFMQTGGFAISNDSSGAPASTMAYIKGSGTTSATTALLVQNSAGDDLFKVEDGGLIDIGGANGYAIQSNSLSPKINGYLALDRNSNRTFNIGDSNASRTYLKVQSSLTSNFADVSINTDHLFVKKEGNVAIGTSTIDASAKLQVDSTTQGFLPPRMTTTERDAISTPAAGLMVYNTDTNTAECWNGSAWMPMF